jgi:hypothetical protein
MRRACYVTQANGSALGRAKIQILRFRGCQAHNEANGKGGDVGAAASMCTRILWGYVTTTIQNWEDVNHACLLDLYTHEIARAI